MIAPVSAGSKSPFGAWLSLVERLVRDQEVGGSNPLAPTKFSFKINHLKIWF